MNTRRNGKISYSLQPISIIPLIFLGILIVVLGGRTFTKAMHSEVETELRYVVSNTITLFDTAYPGDYELYGDTALRLYKGDTDITFDYSLIDKIKSDTDLDITLFYADTRILTTVTDENGERIVGTGASDTIVNDVLYGEKAEFYTNALVGTENYFSYYTPLTNSDGSVVGMLFAGKPREQIDLNVQRCLYPLIIAVGLTIIVLSACLALYTKSLVNTLVKIRNYVSAVSNGKLDAELSEKVLSRNDELGEIGFSIQTMHRSLRTQADIDTLTGLYNRRCANRKLNAALEKAQNNNTPLCIALGDIDFFKKINDTYGHECGDVVLRQVSYTLKERIRKCGFVARWGGEEFLMVLEDVPLEEATKILNELCDSISKLKISYEDQTIRLTMTMGVTANNGSGPNNLLRIADEMLYEGKTNGRNQVVANNMSKNDDV